MSTLKKKILLIYGLPGSGKTTLAKLIAEKLGPRAIWFNADKVRSTLSSDLKFSPEARMEQARRMGCLASLGLDGSIADVAIVDFVNPTVQTFSTFMANTKRPKGNQLDDSFRVPCTFMNGAEYPVFSVFMNTLKKDDSRFKDTAAMFESASDVRKPDFVVDKFISNELEFEGVARNILDCLEDLGH